MRLAFLFGPNWLQSRRRRISFRRRRQSHNKVHFFATVQQQIAQSSVWEEVIESVLFSPNKSRLEVDLVTLRRPN